MLNHMTRSRAIQIWFVAVALVVAAGLTFGAAMTVGTGAMLVALCLVPPAMILLLWPGIDHPTIAEVLHDTERRA